MKIKKLVIMLMIIFCAAMILTPISMGFDWSGALSTVDEAEGVTELNTSATNVTGAILSVCKYVAVGVALIMLVIIAAKYMIASAGDRADIKKHAVAYVVGAVILFGSAAILEILQSFADNTLGSTASP